ncbi:hypothetical protein HU200_060904 [Digitaria exilis]|uniref:Xylulose kinase n=1 Tax=Digitaria exilis TaxID=1010633 RepID=A0A835DX15_9POAL|nr:hypothetical protein HU200_060904 [Digitaria exilis]
MAQFLVLAFPFELKLKTTRPLTSNPTRSLKATVLDAGLAIVATDSVHFDSNLPHYGTHGGVLRDPTERGRIVSPPLMWAEALDLLLSRLRSRADLRRVAAVSGSAQQHGSVYWAKGAATAALDPARGLAPQLAGAFAAPESPVWMDSSTAAQCREVEAAMGGPLRLAALTGPEVYDATERVSLVSSFMASLLVGGYACIDETDGAGMNIMDINTRQLREDALQATAPNLEGRIGKLAPAHAVAGKVAPYFVQRFQFASSCLVIQWSGDNPNSFAGLTLSNPGDLAISLGTSDTVFGITDSPEPTLEGNIFPNPVDPKTYMVLLCYKNGSLTREDHRDRYAERSWDTFNRLLEETAPLNGGKLGFYYKEHEILPPLPDSASLGAALRAAHGWLCNQEDKFVPFSYVYSGRLDTSALSMQLAVPFGDCDEDTELLNKYTLLVKKRLEIEQKLIERFSYLSNILGTALNGVVHPPRNAYAMHVMLVNGILLNIVRLLQGWP